MIGVTWTVAAATVAVAAAVGAVRRSRVERLHRVVGDPELRPPARRPARPLRPADLARLGKGRWLGGLAGVVAGLLGMRLAGVPAAIVGAAIGIRVPAALRSRDRAGRDRKLEAQLADVAESTAMAVRSGLSVVRALEFAAGEVPDPMAGLVSRLLASCKLGAPFEAALEAFGREVGTEDARLFVLVVSINHRAGGNLAGALEEVGGTIRGRVAVRRELRALTAQGRMSGAILVALPIVFFLLLATTSGGDLAATYRSAAGQAMIAGGLAMEVVAFLWLRRIMVVRW